MTIILFEGPDQVGKSTVIESVKKKYPHTITMQFPTPQRKQWILEDFRKQIDFDNPQHVLDYHYAFMEDIASMQNMLRIFQKKTEDVVVLVDRYYYSNAAYFMTDFTFYLERCIEKNIISDRERNRLIYSLEETLISFYRDLVHPDLVFFLYSPMMSDEEIEKEKEKEKDSNFIDRLKNDTIQRYFQVAFKMVVPRSLAVVEGKTDKTEYQIEEVLKAKVPGLVKEVRKRS